MEKLKLGMKICHEKNYGKAKDEFGYETSVGSSDQLKEESNEQLVADFMRRSLKKDGVIK